MSEHAMFTDLYEMTMTRSYLRENHQGEAVFELYFRELPPARKFIIAAGLDALLEQLENFRYSEQNLDYLRRENVFSEEFLNELARFRFTGDIWAMPEGTAVFPYEPLVQVVAPLPEAQLIETLVLNQIHFASIAAAKAARIVLCSGNRRVIDFGSRRAHGLDAGLIVARAAWLAGFDGTSLMEAGERYGIPIVGTMAHSYVQSYDEEMAAFRDFLKSFPEATLLVDTYDTIKGVGKVIELSREMGDDFRVRAVRLDSGDLGELAQASRQLLDDAGLQQVKIVASGGLNEYKLQSLCRPEIPIEGFGVGTSLAVSDDAPALDMAYKLVELDGKPRTKLSSSKTIYPGKKQVYRIFEDGEMSQDVVAPVESPAAGAPLLEKVMEQGRRTGAGHTNLHEARQRVREQYATMPDWLKAMEPGGKTYQVEIADQLEEKLEQFRRQYA